MPERAKSRYNGCSCSQASKPQWQEEGSTTIPERDVETHQQEYGANIWRG